MKEPMSLPVDIVEEIERRAQIEGVEPEVIASQLVAEELPRLVADLLLRSTRNAPRLEMSGGADDLISPVSPAPIIPMATPDPGLGTDGSTS
jgi:hypothetical protein